MEEFVNFTIGDQELLIPAEVTDSGFERTKEWLVGNGHTTWQALQEMGYGDSQLATPEGDEVIRQIGDWSMENMDVIAPVAAGIATSAATGGAALPIIASAGAAAIGKFASDTAKAKEGEEVDPFAAMAEGGKSVVTDLGFLAVGRLAKPMLKVMGFGNQQAEAIIETANKREAVAVGSDQSLIQTQNLLTNSGKAQAGLTAFQTQRAGAMATLMENIASVSPFSRGDAGVRFKSNNAAIQEGFTNLIGETPFKDLSSYAIGKNLNELITIGKEAVGANYAVLLDPWERKYGGLQLSNMKLIGNVITNAKETSAIRATVRSKINKPSPETMSPGRTGATDAGGVPTKQVIAENFEKETLTLLDELDVLNSSVVSISAKDLMSMQKKLRNAVTKAGSFDANYNGPLEKQLATLSDEFTSALEETLRRQNPRAADELLAMNTQYREGIKAILPPLNKSALQQAGLGYVEALGDLAVKGSSKSEVDAMKVSIYKAYAEAKKAGSLSKMPFKTADAAFARFREGYIKQLIPNVGTDAFDISQYRTLANKFEDPTSAAAAKAVLGKDWGAFKGLTNAMSEATATPDSFLGSLMVTSKTTSSVGGVLAAGAGAVGLGGAAMAGGADPITTVASAAGWLLAPKVMQKIVSNPKAVNELLTLERRSKKENLTPTFMMSGIAKIINSLSEEEAASIRNLISESILGGIKNVRRKNIASMGATSGEGIVRYRPPMTM
tara:strand:- start:53 stop:2233 length:2181 start_codon:yes stop_codon:yes gene_type:complete